ncbi:ribonuclease-III-like-domain-containing protein [Lasiosphaeria ovina]|uniref:Ribonuclease-III-like-domain-containing protein n=1 Tax=Lasiosphaeria ovina TaxID=92902 RepID=A0AAE0N7M2_9PEZI|nr:ribonuclease-III-like-domain-containing protein [Lasiosphaeria ovina]
MALNSSRSALSSTCKVLRQYRRAPHPLPRPVAIAAAVTASARSFSSSPACRSDPFEALETPNATPSEQHGQPAQPGQVEEKPRWSFTPPKMSIFPFPLSRAKDPRRKIWSNNEDPEKLDAMYNRFLGPSGELMLPDEIKWLAVTHKSFDFGRRGFNTKLAYYGRQILALETTRLILLAPSPYARTGNEDPHDREPFQHPALQNIDKLIDTPPQSVIYKQKMANLAKDIGLLEVIRWKPRMPENLPASGQTVVANTALFAIIGAISLHNGADVAQRVVRDKILRRLGV